MIHRLLAEKLGYSIVRETDFSGVNWIRSLKPVERSEKKTDRQCEREVPHRWRSRPSTEQQDEPGKKNDAETTDPKPKHSCQTEKQRFGSKRASSDNTNTRGKIRRLVIMMHARTAKIRLKATRQTTIAPVTPWPGEGG
jgi:hypothetical protein